MRRGIVLLGAIAIDYWLGEPPDIVHPVVWIGRLIGWMSRRTPWGNPRAECGYGMLLAGVLPIAAVSATVVMLRAVRSRHQMLATASEVWLLKTTFAVRALEEAARCVYLAMEAQDLSRARQAVAMLVSRPVDDLDDWHIASAAIESVAESTADSFVGPWFAYALIGLPGAVGYRVVNTLDSMIGYRGRYEHVGRVSARLDDLINLSISRLAAVCVVFAAWRPGTTARTAWHVMRRDHGLTASPNAGWPMAAMAGALGIVLEKPNQYRINDGAAIPLAFDIGRATNLMRRTAVVAAVATVLFVVLVKRGRSDAHE